MTHCPFRLTTSLRASTVAGLPPGTSLACFSCNNHKGPNIAGRDPNTGRMVRLFNPRSDEWQQHFLWNGPLLVGQTSIGRSAIAVLEINLPRRVALREALIEEGVFPPAAVEKRPLRKSKSTK